MKTYIIGLIVGLTLLICFNETISSNNKPKLKTLSLPEEFMEITNGDTLGIYESNDTVYLEFYRGDIRPNSKYKLLISN